jgi:CubicO group peptidase (beta-lactamase class C family)
MSKAYTAAGVNILVNQHKLAWDTPASRILPDFVRPDTTVREHAALVDFLSYRTGSTSETQMWVTEFCLSFASKRIDSPIFFVF